MVLKNLWVFFLEMKLRQYWEDQPINAQSGQKRPDNFGDILLKKTFFLKTFEGEKLIRSQTTILVQIFCELSLYSQVIFKSMIVADDTF